MATVKELQTALVKANATIEALKAQVATANEKVERANEAAASADAGKQSAEKRAQSAEAGKQSAEERVQSAEAGKQSAEKRAQNAEAGKQSAEERAQNAEARAQSAEASKLNAEARAQSAETKLEQSNNHCKELQEKYDKVLRDKVAFQQRFEESEERLNQRETLLKFERLFVKDLMLLAREHSLRLQGDCLQAILCSTTNTEVLEQTLIPKMSEMLGCNELLMRDLIVIANLISNAKGPLNEHAHGTEHNPRPPQNETGFYLKKCHEILTKLKKDAFSSPRSPPNNRQSQWSTPKKHRSNDAVQMIINRSTSDSVQKAIETMPTTKSTKKRKGRDENQPDNSVSPASSLKVLKKTAKAPVPDIHDQSQFPQLSSGKKTSSNQRGDQSSGGLNANAA